MTHLLRTLDPEPLFGIFCASQDYRHSVGGRIMSKGGFDDKQCPSPRPRSVGCSSGGRARAAHS